jgi:hypothetical protein
MTAEIGLLRKKIIGVFWQMIFAQSRGMRLGGVGHPPSLGVTELSKVLGRVSEIGMQLERNLAEITVTARTGCQGRYWLRDHALGA